jgi:hypothetical protein|tara:strand:+ start:393 stop:620 length:228 start_codon:yes stop_codon:yes gene_type:complete
MISCKTKKKREKKAIFPKIMKSKDDQILVFFNSKNQGMVIKKKSGFNKIGQYSDFWNMKNFEDYNKEVIFQNKLI